ncbi:hypothetical protein K4L06_01805 [Lysobacter sp. BMK333-48F3]|uniref:hypothetical protein n=1 Tax=Lysobacter sp. BMK333-48F3 TaxID=2867962 RepID=UPI001C8B4FC5|nr:hypothetical protein [Lysobacter sp. BMK333-48F3]MBX9400028.1 hypothetical protein [Lysobacter sp. BMK333-48F3]
MTFAPTAKAWTIAALIIAVCAYWIGLDGPFLLDDLANLTPVQQWAHGRIPWHEAVFGNYSGALGRPVSMASFLLTAGPLGNHAFTFKLGNLLVHLGCGWLIWQLMRRLLARDARLSPRADAVAALIASLWLLHPLHASTVLYAVQRMAQLATLFSLASVLIYVEARTHALAGDDKGARLRLFLGFPLLYAAGLLSKENAAVVPALCAVIELAYFAGAKRDRAVVAFYSVFLALPAAAIAAIFVFAPERPLGGYAVLDFTPVERLLSQGRALADYLGQLLFPRIDSMGLYTDDFRASTGLLAPASTLACLTLLFAVTVGAFLLRRRLPSVFAGWMFFLVAHAVESTILPLELYYEHRNYLPSVGVFLAIAGLIGASLSGRRQAWRAATAVAIVALATLSWLTLQRALTWRDKDAIVDLALTHHPESLRASQTKAMRELNARAFEPSMAILQRIADGDRPRDRLQARIDLATVRCYAGLGVPADYFGQDVMADARPKITVGEVQAFDVLARASRDGRCGALTDDAVLAAMERQLQTARDQPERALPKQQFRFLTAIVAAQTGQWPRVAEQAQLAWRHGGSAEVGLLLARARVHLGDLDGAAEALRAAEPRIAAGNRFQRRQADEVRGLIEQARTPSNAPAGD